MLGRLDILSLLFMLIAGSWGCTAAIAPDGSSTELSEGSGESSSLEIWLVCGRVVRFSQADRCSARDGRYENVPSTTRKQGTST